MTVAAFTVSVVALLIAMMGVAYGRRSANAAKRSADAAQQAADVAAADDRRARTPDLSIWLRSGGQADSVVIYGISNYGPQDLDAVRVYGPRPADGLRYPIAVTGDEYAEDDIDLGPLPLGSEANFTLGCGSSLRLPDFYVRIECHAGSDKWEFAKLLPSPRSISEMKSPPGM